MISLKGIQKAHSRMTYRRIYQLIYPRHRERFFRTSTIEICKVHTHAPLSYFLFPHYSVSQSLTIKHLSNSLCLLKFGYFTLNSLYMFLGRASRWLPFWSNGWTEIKNDDDKWNLDLALVFHRRPMQTHPHSSQKIHHYSKKAATSAPVQGTCRGC